MSAATSKPDAVPPPPRHGKREWLLAIVAAVIGFIVFIPALDNEFVDWDDIGVLVENPHYRGLGADQIRWMFTTNHYGHYQPVTWLTYGLDYELWEMNPYGYHLTNNLFHAANALLMYFLALGLLRRAFSEDGSGRSPAGGSVGGSVGGRWRMSVSLAALAAALFFATHPLRVESVAWVTERRDLVSAFFLLLTMLCYLRATAGRGSWPWIVVTLVVYAVSMISKVGGAPLPAVLLVLDWYPLRRWRRGRGEIVRALVEKIPFFVIAIGFATSTVAQQADKWLYPLEKHDFVARTAQAFYGLVFYAWKTFLPLGLSPLYELRFPMDPFEARFIVSVVLVIAGFIALVVAARRWPGPLAAALCYAFMLGPLLGFFQNGPQIVADRYSYLSTAGWVIVAVGAFHQLAVRRGRAVAKAVVAAGVAAVLALSVMTWRQADVWQDTGTLWSAILASDPDGSYANNSYGCVLLSRDQFEAAIPHFHKAIEVNPENQKAYYNLWGTLRELGRTDELEDAYRAAANAPLIDVRADTRYRLGTIALRAERNEEAIEWFHHALSVREAHPQTHNNLAMTLARLNDTDAAITHYRRALELDPALPNARYGLARMLDRQGKYDEALSELDRLQELHPDHANARGLRAEIVRKRD